MESPGLGVTGFMLGLTDASIVAVDERRFLMQSPSGRYRTFRRDRKNLNILESGPKWVGEIKGDMITVSLECGAKLVFHRGAISQLQVKERTFDFIRNGNRVTEIREGGRTLASLRENRLTGAVELVQRNGEVITFEMGKRPQVQALAGSPRPVIGGFIPTVSRIVQPDGTETSFKFGTNKELLPVVEVGTGEQGSTRSLTWNPATGEMFQDGEWKYEIKQGEKPFENAAIGRENTEKQKEFWHYDSIKGVEETQTVDGKMTKRTWFTSGKFAGTTRSISKYVPGQKEFHEKRHYDEKGRLFRKICGDQIYSYRYEPNGISAYLNGELIWVETFDKAGKLTSVFGSDRKHSTAISPVFDGSVKLVEITSQ